ncbi:MAG TPA: TnsD family transposase [Blastocatellia bacterium]|nr:TnsD family transposase [Blastocatellia bacterium]
MLSFFPTPYPDELLYSILARYHIRSGNFGPKATLRDLFGSTKVVATYDLPSHIDALVQRLPPYSRHTAESLINEHTLYPFYAPFLPPVRARLILNSMEEHSWGDIHARIGIMASSVKPTGYLKFCPECLQADEEAYGEPYWHRLHQVPGVLVCPKHFTSIYNSSVRTFGEDRHEFYPATQENCIIPSPQASFPGEIMAELRLVAQDIEWVLSTPLSSREAAWFQHQYKSLLIDIGLATGSGRIRQAYLRDRFRSRFWDELLGLLQSSINDLLEDDWLSGIVRKHRRTFHPIRHIFLIRFLSQPITSFFDQDLSYKAFGNGPWKCFNGAAKHYLQTVIDEVKITWSHEMKKSVGIFSCKCGFIYCTSDPKQLTGQKVTFGKILAFGLIWERKLRKLAKQPGYSLREAARQLKVDPRTVKRQVERLGISSPWIKAQSALIRDTPGISRKEQREKWTELRREHPRDSKILLRGKAPALYTWLYRNDRSWLDKNSPPRFVRAQRVARVDWRRRDGEVLRLVKGSVQKILQRVPPVRVTQSRIGKAIGLVSLLERHLDKLPLTQGFLTSVVESIEDFQIRRIKHVIQELAQRGSQIRGWQVVRLSGLGRRISPKVAEAIAEGIFRACSRKESNQKAG